MNVSVGAEVVLHIPDVIMSILCLIDVGTDPSYFPLSGSPLSFRFRSSRFNSTDSIRVYVSVGTFSDSNETFLIYANLLTNSARHASVPDMVLVNSATFLLNSSSAFLSLSYIFELYNRLQ